MKQMLWHADAMMEDGFEETMSNFCRKHMHSFEDTEENKLEHMQIFSNYVNLLESLIQDRLSQHLQDFDMEAFQAWLGAQSQERLGSDVLDTLLSATDFETFKQHMLSYKSEAAMSSLHPLISSAPCAHRNV
jgi:hypothetical protein